MHNKTVILQSKYMDIKKGSLRYLKVTVIALV